MRFIPQIVAVLTAFQIASSADTTVDQFAESARSLDVDHSHPHPHPASSPSPKEVTTQTDGKQRKKGGKKHPTPPTPVYNTGVYDNHTFMFPLKHNGENEACSWLTRSEEAMDDRREKYCVEDDIVENCPIACGTGSIDDPNFTFPLNFNGDVKPCGWLVINEDAMDDRRSRYCGDVGFYCPQSCGYHPFNLPPTPLPTMAPGPTPNTPTGTGVSDDPSFYFPVEFNPQIDKSCKWITNDPGRVDYRRETYCGDKSIAESCPISCGFNKFDDPDFTFPLKYNGALQPCNWLKMNDQATTYRRDTYCGMIGTFCPESCGYYPYNSFGHSTPSKSPTKKTSSPTHCAPTTNAPTPATGGVHDDDDFLFPIDSDGSMQHCSWLTANEDAAHRRKEKYCVRHEILESCPITCDTRRFDDPDFTFTLINDGTVQSCSWLTANADAIDHRREMYCIDVGASCPVSCGFHPYNIPVTSAPTVPTATMAPTPATGGVHDDDDFLFPIDSDGSMQHCSWLTANEDAAHRRKEKYCVRHEILESCPITCDTRRFDDPDFTFTLINDGTVQSCSWLTANADAIDHRREMYCIDVGASCPVSCGFHPYNIPVTSAPTVPTATMAPTPATGGVHDDDDFLFPIDSDGSMQHCSWLTANEDAAHRRKEKYCVRHEILESCPISCDTRRFDDPDFTFTLINDGTVQSCSWLTANADAIDHRREMYCIDVGASCPVSCGFHPYNIPVTSAPTVPTATMAPTPATGGVHDDDDFLFPIDYDGSMKPCTWLTANEDAAHRRKEKYCVRHEVVESCPITCDTRRFDDPDFTFTLINDDTVQSCSWLTANVDAIDNRRSTYCGDIGISCPISCGYHPYNIQITAAPTTAPTPSFDPVHDDLDFRFEIDFTGEMKRCSWLTVNNEASEKRKDKYCVRADVIESCPISCGTKKFDDPTFTFPLDYNGGMVECNWLTANLETIHERRETYCGRSGVGTHCPVSCGWHPYNIQITSSPTIAPSSSPITTPPTIEPVHDDDDFLFPIDYDGSMKPCAWLAVNEDAAHRRKEIYCVRPDIVESCPISCDTRKFDDPNFTFTLINDGSVQSCSWLTANREAMEYRRDIYCGDIGISCPVSCGYHPYNELTSAPTVAPTPSTGGVYDDDSFLFPIDLDGSMKPCSWLTVNAEASDTRKEKYCARHDIVKSCPISCGSRRFDDPNFSFPLEHNGAMEKCYWLSINEEAMEFRRMTYCGEVGMHCPESCAYHGYNTADTRAPTPSVTNAPTPSGQGVYDDVNFRFPLIHDGSMQSCSWITRNPAVVNYRKTTYCVDKNILGSCPISCGTNKFDDPDYTFESNFNGAMQKCSWIGGDYRKNIYCSDMSIAASCPESCEFHPYNTFPSPPSPPVNPGTSAPTPSPPSGNGVYDDNNFRFPLLHDGSMQPCFWITLNPSAVNYRRETYCVDRNIIGSCPISCGTNKFDDPSFTFPSNFNGALQKCDWIGGEYRKAVYCVDMNIAASCPESCEFHPYNTFPSPAPPPRPVTPVNPVRPSPPSAPTKNPKKGKGGKGKKNSKKKGSATAPPLPAPVPNPSPPTNNIASAVTSGGKIDVQSIFATITTVLTAFTFVFFA